jgi:hypothetical protein
MTEAGMWLGDGAEAQLGGSIAAWRDALPLRGTPSEVFARAAMRSREDIAEDKAREERRAELRRRAQDQADLIRLGMAPEPPTHHDVLMRAAALGAIQDKREEAQRQRQLQADAERAVERLAQTRRDLEKETVAHTRAIRQANDAHHARHEAEQQSESYRRAVYGS